MHVPLVIYTLAILWGWLFGKSRRSRWHEKLGYDASAAPLSVATVKNAAAFTIMGDPVAVQRDGMVFNEYTRYAYVV